MAFSVEHAKRMRAALERAGKRTVQIGHQGCSSGQVTDAVNFLRTGYLGKVTAIHAHMYRNTPHGKPAVVASPVPGHDSGKYYLEEVFPG